MRKLLVMLLLFSPSLASAQFLITSPIGCSGYPNIFRCYDAGIVIEGDPGLMALFNTTNPGGLGPHETAFAFGAYDSAGARKKTGSLSSLWANTSASTGFGVIRLNATYNGGVNDDVLFLGCGSRGVKLWPDDPYDCPGYRVFQVPGKLLTKWGEQVGNTPFYLNARFQNAAGTKGVILGYDANSVTGIIAPEQANSSLAVWTHNDTDGWKERVKFSRGGAIVIQDTVVSAPNGSLFSVNGALYWRSGGTDYKVAGP